MPIQYPGGRATPRLELGVAVQEFIQTADEFVGTKIMPIFKTKKKAATFSAITRDYITQDVDTKRSSRGNYNRIGVGAKDKSFNCAENGLENPLGDDERALYQTDFQAELVCSKVTARAVLQAQEKRIAAKIFNTTTFTGSALYTDNTANPWATIATDIIGQVSTGKQKIRSNTGLLPNALLMNYANFENCKKNTAILNRIQYNKVATDAEVAGYLAALFGVDNILIAKGILNSAKEGQTFVSGDIWSSNFVLFGLIDPSGEDLSIPSVGRTFLWTEDSPDNALVEQYRDDTIRSDVFRVRQNTDENLIDPYFGHLMKVG